MPEPEEDMRTIPPEERIKRLREKEERQKRELEETKKKVEKELQEAERMIAEAEFEEEERREKERESAEEKKEEEREKPKQKENLEEMLEGAPSATGGNYTTGNPGTGDIYRTVDEAAQTLEQLYRKNTWGESDERMYQDAKTRVQEAHSISEQYKMPSEHLRHELDAADSLLDRFKNRHNLYER
jgi:predicted ribosome quality control (RQC) complex YloA/Tae2 family protein